MFWVDLNDFLKMILFPGNFSFKNSTYIVTVLSQACGFGVHLNLHSPTSCAYTLLASALTVVKGNEIEL